MILESALSEQFSRGEPCGKQWLDPDNIKKPLLFWQALSPGMKVENL